jgi:predicted PurR-regulated permease PerM
MGEDPSLARTTALQARGVLERASLTINQGCLIVLMLTAVVYTLYFAAAIILPFVLAMALNAVLAPALRFMNRKMYIPRFVAALFLILSLSIVLWALGYAVAVPAAGWIAKTPQSIPTLIERLSFLRQPLQFLEQGLQAFQGLMSPVNSRSVVEVKQVTDAGGSILGIGFTVLAGGRALIGQGLTVLLLLFFFLASSESLIRRLVEILPHFDDKRRVVSVVSETEDAISHYLLTVSLMNGVVGLLTGSAVWLLGMPDPLLFGTVAFLLNYIPVLGPFTGVVIFFFAGIFYFPTALQALIPAGLYLGIHILEGEMITPVLLARRFTLNSVIVISSLIFWDWLWGIPGALLSTPLLAVMKIVCDHVEVLSPIGHLIGGTSGKGSDPSGPR